MAVSLLDLAQKAVSDVANDDAFWQEIESDLALAMLRLNGRAHALGLEAAASLGVPVDFDAVHQEALVATRRATFEQVRRITDTTREGLREALISWQQTGLVTPEQQRRGLPTLIDGLEPLFGKPRARRIAVTETTRLFAEGNELAVADDETVGGYQWQTAHDERVCAICGPRDGRVYPKGSGERPPAHVHCRCGWIPVSWHYIRQNRGKWQGDASSIPSREAWQ